MNTPFHRIHLHWRCARRRPAHWRWHFAGAFREVPAALYWQLAWWIVFAATIQMLTLSLPKP